MLGARDTEALPLYTAIVARGRELHWYVEGQVADTIDGRFDMIAGVLAFVLLRLEDDPAGAETVARVTERFVDDMDGQLRQIGIGDIIVGKHIGKMMSMLGGRIGAYRDALAAGDLDAALVRNLYRGETPSEPALRHVAARLYALRDALVAAPTAAIIAGDLP
ncbi:ubiquinol-cytochrome C chaperone family protein [Sphingomonas sp. H39-1-10]|uniref:ubiquinol-cytochrome C chaperone family protein n=1 Tax=Sphingomonas pollutisoli TaxID=3030829 RepID=UPI0023B9B25B|nr:ubiquinol-cytochrome C chaperone family protein [Sphingomonas pollutisoli]MDF0488089.1 ubiquinol-cytochrome C chaperone family protein [Sphingomonas pollutisoli]